MSAPIIRNAKFLKNFKYQLFVNNQPSECLNHYTKIHIRTYLLPSYTYKDTPSYTNVCRRNGQRLLPCGIGIIRHNSTQAVQIESISPASLDPNYLPPPPSLPIPEQIDISSSLNALGEPTLSSLGLCNWTPPGLVQACLEALHVSLDVPWWGAIMAGVVCLRLLIFPIVIISQRNMINMANHMPRLTLLHQKFQEAQQSNNFLEITRLAKEIQDYMKKYEITPFRNFLMPLVQMPIFISVFFGLRKMAELPVESMKTGGLSWFTDLTIADPYYLLPLLSMGTMSLIIEIGADGMKTGAMSNTMKWVFRSLPVVFLPIVSHFPAAMLVYWCTSNMISLCQTLFLRVPVVRQYFKIPKNEIPDAASLPPKKAFVESFRETIHNSRVISEMQNRERHDALRFKEAGVGPIKKTYKNDPTKPLSSSRKPTNKKIS